MLRPQTTTPEHIGEQVNAKRYKLPDWLGGHEFSNPQPIERGPFLSGLVTNGGTTIVLQIGADALEVIQEPEPGDGTDWIDEDCVVFCRRDGWKASQERRHWYSTDSGGPNTWQDVLGQAVGELSQLIRNPATAAPDLPHREEDEQDDRITVSRRTAYPGVTIVATDIVHLAPHQGRRVAAAILRAVVESEAGRDV